MLGGVCVACHGKRVRELPSLSAQGNEKREQASWGSYTFNTVSFLQTSIVIMKMAVPQASRTCRCVRVFWSRNVSPDVLVFRMKYCEDVGNLSQMYVYRRKFQLENKYC